MRHQTMATGKHGMHYGNTHMQYTVIFNTAVKIDTYQMKSCEFFLKSVQTYIVGSG